MVIFNLRWLCTAFLFVPLVVQANKVSTEVAAGTTSYKVINETISTPLGTTVSPPRDINPVPRLEKLPSGGISQSASGDLYVADKKAKFGFTGKFKFDKETLNGGAKKLLKLNPLSLAGAVGLMGLEQLLREHGLEPGADNTLTKPSDLPYEKLDEYPPSDKYKYFQTAAITVNNLSGRYPVGSTAYQGGAPFKVLYVYQNSKGYYDSLGCFLSVGSEGLTAYKINSGGGLCYYGVNNPDDAPNIPRDSVSPADIDNIVDSSYDSDVSDWPALFPYIAPDAFELDPIPSFSFPPVTSTSTSSSTGLVTTIESQTVLDFQVDNSTATPSITITESETSTKYEDGVKVDETTTVVPSTPSQPSTGGGGGVTGADDAFELPSFCSWASVVCNWIGWTQELPDGSDPDLSSLVNDDDFTRDYTISFGAKQCPAPMQLNVALLKDSIEVSFDPFCELAGYLYYFVMVSAYLIAIRISLGVSRDG